MTRPLIISNLLLNFKESIKLEVQFRYDSFFIFGTYFRSALILLKEIFCNNILQPTIDTISDPDIINQLLLLLFDETPMKDFPEATDPNVEFLEKFMSTTSIPRSSVSGN